METRNNPNSRGGRQPKVIEITARNQSVNLSTFDSSWNERRLTRLFQHYNHKFFGGRLSGWMVSFIWDEPFQRTNEDGLGFVSHCNLNRQRIFADPSGCDSDYEVRHTLLGVMAHGVTKDLEHSLDSAWAAEIDRLRAEGARIPTARYHIRWQRRQFEQAQ